MAHIKTFKSPSTIKFETSDSVESHLREARRGSTFLCDGAICMLSSVHAYQAIKDMQMEVHDAVIASLSKFLWVTNLQTGRTYTRAPDTPIQFIKISMTVEGQ